MLVIISFIVCSWLTGVYSATVCTPNQCVNGTVDIGNSLGALLGNSQTLLLPGQYSSTSPSQVVSSVLSSSLTLPPYLSSSSNTLPLTIQVQPGLAVFPSPLYHGSPSFISLNTTDGNITVPSGDLKAGSVLLSQNAFAVFGGSNNRPLILWDTLPDLSQLPLGSLDSNGGSVTLLDVESSE
ncbi:hypothetical protein FRC03_003896 [Tulasnella sp. 419]|nr:hypothetical protein FRC03_003896 [Tulasnella sp. 419]